MVAPEDNVMPAESAGAPLCFELPDRTRLRLERRAVVHADPERDLHGPCVVRTASGDLLLSHQDSQAHHGGDGFVHQWRSRDDGESWLDEGPAADWRDRGLDALFGEYGVTPDGRLVMLVQLRHPGGGNEAIRNSVWYTSEDEGRSWAARGEIDASHPHAVLFGREVVTWGQTMYFGAWSRRGNGLYVSEDQGYSWRRRSVLFPCEHPDFGRLAEAGPPFYPHVMFTGDGELLAVTYITPPTNCCYFRRSGDEGHSWGPVERRDDVNVWAPRLGLLGALLVLTGRDIERKATVLRASADGGHTWSGPHVIDCPSHEGSYGYTDHLALEPDNLWISTSSPQSPGRGDILGLRFRHT